MCTLDVTAATKNGSHFGGINQRSGSILNSASIENISFVSKKPIWPLVASTNTLYSYEKMKSLWKQTPTPGQRTCWRIEVIAFRFCCFLFFQHCAHGYTRSYPGPNFSPCVSCPCNQHSKECDPENGQCVVSIYSFSLSE